MKNHEEEIHPKFGVPIKTVPRPRNDEYLHDQELRSSAVF